MIWAWALVPRWIKRAVAWLAAGMALLWGARLSGRRSANAETKLRDALSRAERLRRDNETLGRMADVPLDGDPDDARKRMFNRDASTP